MPVTSVDRVVAQVVPWSGVQIRDGGHDAAATPARSANAVHVGVRLSALLTDGVSVSTDQIDFGITVPRSSHDLIGDIEALIDQMLGRDPRVHRPPRLAWGGLIDALAKAGVLVTEQQLIETPFSVELSPPATADIAGDEPP